MGKLFVTWQASEPQHFLYDPVSIASRQLSSALAAAVTMTTPRSATEADRSAPVRTGTTAATKTDAQPTWVISNDNDNSIIIIIIISFYFFYTLGCKDPEG